MISERSGQVLAFITDFWKQHGYGPSIREIQYGSGHRSTNGTRFHIHKLRIAGLITSTPRVARSIRLIAKDGTDDTG